MTKNEFFSLSFHRKCQYMKVIHDRLYRSNTIEERNRATPAWLVGMVAEFEMAYGYIGFASHFLGSLLMTFSDEEIEEIVCILIEIHLGQLNQSIMELDRLIGLSWSRESDNGEDKPT